MAGVTVGDFGAAECPLCGDRSDVFVAQPGRLAGGGTGHRRPGTQGGVRAGDLHLLIVGDGDGLEGFVAGVFDHIAPGEGLVELGSVGGIFGVGIGPVGRLFDLHRRHKLINPHIPIQIVFTRIEVDRIGCAVPFGIRIVDIVPRSCIPRGDIVSVGHYKFQTVGTGRQVAKAVKTARTGRGVCHFDIVPIVQFHLDVINTVLTHLLNAVGVGIVPDPVAQRGQCDVLTSHCFVILILRKRGYPGYDGGRFVNPPESVRAITAVPGRTIKNLATKVCQPLHIGYGMTIGLFQQTDIRNGTGFFVDFD